MTKIILAYELMEQQAPKTHIAEHLGVSRRTVIRWSQEIRRHGSLDNYLKYYRKAKKGPRKKRVTNDIIKRRIWDIRKKHHQYCGQKIQYFLEKDYGIRVSLTTIYKVLKEKYQLRSKWQKNQKRGPVRSAKAPREVIQMDTVDFGGVFAFTAIDIFTKESDVLLRPSLEATDGQAFLHHSMTGRFNRFSEIIQTDGGKEFKKEFEIDAANYCNLHRIARPYRKNEQCFIVSFNRSLRKICLRWIKYQESEIPGLTSYVEDWLRYYHYIRPHISLGIRLPLENQV